MTGFSEAWGRLRRGFVAVSGGMLGMAGLLKLASLLDGGGVLRRVDPVLAVPNWVAFALLGPLEVALAVYLVRSRRHLAAVFCIAWVGTLFGNYHLALSLTGLFGCPCLGTNLAWMGLSAAGAARLAAMMTAFLMVGGYVFLIVEML